MFTYIYKKLMLNKATPLVMSKLNLWNILNKKHSYIGTVSILFFTKNPVSLLIRSINAITTKSTSARGYAGSIVVVCAFTLLLAVI